MLNDIDKKGIMIENSGRVDEEAREQESVVLESLTTKEVERGIISLIHKGRWSKADLFLISIEGHNFVLKDFSKKSLFIRLLGCLQIWNESRAYCAIQGIPGIPKFYKKLNPWSFVMEHVEGVRLVDYKGDVPIRKLLERLNEIISAVNRAGVFHNDIRGRENVVIGKDGRLKLIDFAGAVCFKPGGSLYKILSPIFRWVDYSAYLKWKSKLVPEDMEEREKRSLRRFNVLRKFWIFNIKRQK